MQVLFSAFEAEPFLKTGGLGDVAGSLPTALMKLNHGKCSGKAEAFEYIDIRVMLPKASLIPAQYVEKMEFVTSFYVALSWRNEYCGLFQLKHNGVTFYFLDNERYFFRGQLYGEFDDGERLAFFSKAVLEAALHIPDFAPDIIHSNDWHTALIPVFLREFYGGTKLSKAKSVFTIHNLKFQGVFSDFVIGDILGLQGTPAESQLKWPDEQGDAANFMKAACLYADKITTVSPTYAKEICTSYFGENLDWLFNKRKPDLAGILNGIDCDAWNPAKDPAIKGRSKKYPVARYTNYSSEALQLKVNNKLALQKELGLKVDPDIPMFAIISRLTEQKGLDLVTYLLPHMKECNIQLVVLGVGDKKYEETFAAYGKEDPSKFAVLLKFDGALAHKINAAADVSLVPSRFEPCGLTQMNAMRYGTLPLVRETGGLADTVDNSNGFSFLTFNGDDFKYALDCALDVWFNKHEEWVQKQLNAMSLDFSWKASAAKYLELYKELIK